MKVYGIKSRIVYVFDGKLTSIFKVEEIKMIYGARVLSVTSKAEIVAEIELGFGVTVKRLLTIEGLDPKSYQNLQKPLTFLLKFKNVKLKVLDPKKERSPVVVYLGKKSVKNLIEDRDEITWNC